MDPNANLEEQLRLASRVSECECEGDCTGCTKDGKRLAELVLALDERIRKGGFLPIVWKEGPNGVCESTCHGWACTLPAGHRGAHRACIDNANQTAAHVWMNRG